MPLPGPTGGNPARPKKPLPYRNPLRGVQNLRPERVDMGVDYSGYGPVYALGRGVVTEADTAWAGGVGAVGPGTFIAYRLTEGPAAGHYVYVSENILPNVSVGQQVNADTVIGTMTGQGAGIETGWAAGPTGGVTLAAAAGQSSTSGDPGARPTAWGNNFSQLLAKLGAPAGIVPPGGGIVGTVERWAENLLGDVFGGTNGGGGSGLFDGGLLGLPGNVLQAFDDLDKLVNAAMWLFQPSNWVRIVAGIFGAVFLIAGIAALTRAA